MLNFKQQIERAKQLRQMAKINAAALDDSAAVEVRTLYDEWKKDEPVVEGDRRYYPPTDILYKCAAAHTTQADWTPDVAITLWTPVDVEHKGSLEDPIPAMVGMEYTKGKYYIENNVIYLMDRAGMADGESVVLHYLPSQLVGQYFELVK